MIDHIERKVSIGKHSIDLSQILTPKSTTEIIVSTPVQTDSSPSKPTSALKAKYLAVKEKIQHNKDIKIVAESNDKCMDLFYDAALSDIKARMRSEVLVPDVESKQAPQVEVKKTSTKKAPVERVKKEKRKSTSIPSSRKESVDIEEDEYIRSLMLSDNNYDRKGKKRIDYTMQALEPEYMRPVKTLKRVKTEPVPVKRKYSMKNRSSTLQMDVSACSTPPDLEEKEVIRKSKFASVAAIEVDEEEESFSDFDWKGTFDDIGRSAYLKTNKEIRRLREHAYPPNLLELNLTHSKLEARLDEFTQEEREYIVLALKEEQASRLIKRTNYVRRNKLSTNIGKICVAYDFDITFEPSINPQHSHQRKHLTGSSRTEGYYKITDQEKLKYRGKTPVVDQIEVIETEKAIEASAKATSRAIRVQSRNITHGMEVQERAYNSVQFTNQESALVKISHYKKKALKFGKSAIHDWGLFSMERVDMNDIVIEYIGEKIRQKVADDRERKYELSGIGSSYLFRVDDDVIIDATKKGGLARFINHCCDPNCNAKIVTIDGEKRIVIYARRDISIGEEITYDYKFPIEREDYLSMWCKEL